MGYRFNHRIAARKMFIWIDTKCFDDHLKLLRCFGFPREKVTMTDGYKYTVMRRYSQFDQLGARVTPHIRMALPPFPPRHGWRSATVGLRPEDLEERR